MISEIISNWRLILISCSPDGKGTNGSTMKSLTKLLSEKKQEVLQSIRYDLHHSDEESHLKQRTQPGSETAVLSPYIRLFLMSVTQDLPLRLGEASTEFELHLLQNVLDSLIS